MEFAYKEKFTTNLLHWNKNLNNRKMPWKGEKDAYKIWLSEIILQQTRVEQGWSYYEKFIQHFPTIQHLANANDEFVFKLWEGLGYYNRCKNLLITSRIIVKNNAGIFPNSYDELLALKGVGVYTAAAIASFAFNLPYAVVDGNVFRVLARYFGVSTAIDSNKGKKIFAQLAQEVLNKKNAAVYNQAIMDFGATVCKPLMPLCSNCVLKKNCFAINNSLIHHLPIKEKVLVKKNRWMYYFIFQYKKNILVNKRTTKDIWQNLHEFYLIESDAPIFWNEAIIDEWMHQQFLIKNFKINSISSLQIQQLTHQKIKSQFIYIQLFSLPAVLKKYQWIELKKIKQLAFPKLMTQYFESGIFFKNTIT